MIADRRALLGGLAVSPFAGAALARTQYGPPPGTALDAVFATDPAPAMGAMIVARSGVEWLDVRGVRKAGGTDRVTADDRWHLGSNTKAMTAALFARLVEQGRARWAMPLAEALPGVVIDPAWGETTVDDLMHHRAGLMDQTVIGRDWLGSARGDTRSLKDQRAAIAARALGRAPTGPRGAFAYGNANYMLVGAAIEAITGRAWEDEMRDGLFGPLGIATGGFGAPADPNAWGHRVVEGARTPMDPATGGSDNPLALGPAGTAHMSLNDYARFIGVFLNDGGDYLSRDSVRRLTTPAEGAGPPYALGWGVNNQPWAGANGAAGPTLGHEGTNTMWHAFAAVAPERGLAFVTTANDYATGAKGCRDLAIRLMALRTAS